MKKKKLPLGSICVPVLNELENLHDLYQFFCSFCEKYSGSLDFELVITDNHSTDGSWEEILNITRNDSRVRAYRFGRNIGYQKSILFNFRQSRGDFLIQLDADLQDPPEILSEMIDEWLNGAKVVSGRRVDRAEGALVNLLRKTGYSFLSRSSENVLKPDVGDFRLLDREVVRLLVRSKNPTPYLRGMISKLGFQETFINYRRQARKSGVSKFPIVKVLSLGWNGFLSFSSWPLTFVNLMILVSLITCSLLLGVVFLFFFSFIQVSMEFVAVISAISILLLFLAIVASVLLFYVKAIYSVLVDDHSLIVVDAKGESLTYSGL